MLRRLAPLVVAGGLVVLPGAPPAHACAMPDEGPPQCCQGGTGVWVNGIWVGVPSVPPRPADCP